MNLLVISHRSCTEVGEPELSWTSWGCISRPSDLMGACSSSQLFMLCIVTACCHGQEGGTHSLEEDGRTQLLGKYFTIH